MTEGPAKRHWWQEPEEAILRTARGKIFYQFDDSPVRRHFNGDFYLTDRRFAADRRRRKPSDDRPLPIDVPRDRVGEVEVVEVLTGTRTTHRPWFGRRVLRIEIELRGRAMTMGLVLPEVEAREWAEAMESN
ncbi:MAG: hypothetical protein AAGD35_23175 [Actinomycetota bacterium]